MTTKEELRKDLFETIEESSESVKPVINEMVFKMKTASDQDGDSLTWQEIEDIVLDFFEATYKKAIEKMRNKPQE